jgi:dolichol-phosphate mannosyltransferase
MMSIRYNLALIIPVYNEEGLIAQILTSWLTILDREVSSYVIVVLNDGSRDNTAGVLASFKDNPHIQCINKSNSGHGPTILKGYVQAIAVADWVFQCDSDNEISAEQFISFWQQRHNFDALLGIRQGIGGRSLERRIISVCSSMVIRVCFGSAVRDVNVPFRLIKSSVLASLIQHIPEDTFAPNMLISGLLAQRRVAIANIPLTHVKKKRRTCYIVKWSLWKAAFKSLRQTMSIWRRTYKHFG